MQPFHNSPRIVRYMSMTGWLWLATAIVASATELDVWFGTTTPREGGSQGIYHSRLDQETGQLTAAELAAEIQGPGFLALHPDGNVVYSVGNVGGESSVVAFSVEPSGHLSMINSQPIRDGGAAHLSTDRSGRLLMSAQYGGGSLAVFPLNTDRSVAPRKQLLEHEGGSGVFENRQEAPHPHWVGTSPDNRFAFVPDLGLDQVIIYRLDSDRTDLRRHGVGQLPPGGGPRHMKFHPNGQFIYVLNELELSVTVFDYHTERGEMTPVQTVPTVPVKEKAKERFVSASEIRVHPTGRFVYAANRGHDTITAMRVHDSDGQLSVIEIEPVRGSWPRNFNIDPTGRWLLAAGRDSNTIAVFEIDQTKGDLTYTRTMIAVPTPICVLFGARG